MKSIAALLLLGVFTITCAAPAREQQEDYPVFLQELVRSLTSKQLKAELQQEDSGPVYEQQDEDEGPASIESLVKMLAKAQQDEDEDEGPASIESLVKMVAKAQQDEDEDEGPASIQSLVKMLAKVQQDEDEDGEPAYKMQDEDGKRAKIQKWWHHIVRHALHHVIRHFFGKK